MKAIAVAVLGLLLLAGCASGAQVGSIDSGENPAAEPAAVSTRSQADIDEKRAQEREDDPRTAEEERRDEAREAAEQVKKIAGDIRKGITEAHFTMPDVVGGNLQQAQDELQSRGSYLLDQVDATSQHRFQLLDSDWKVCHQSPAAGTRTLKTSLVRLEAVKLDENCP
ncbi:PASTA domain-containing protein [Kineosporia sp. J2-2]|uniref:PASTA domain-containing protein n=1 Tax=Kineosporia corallincola TaxID=2835133 RepID=A0ABS5TNQ2_9ACTN|nr:PASTA domain-containing protein [Kineosporia corallincola]MBT0772727.1 PASTA domain-containing protein [Kineosporia corallincola]